jgi:hypothetical protein
MFKVQRVLVCLLYLHMYTETIFLYCKCLQITAINSENITITLVFKKITNFPAGTDVMII